MSAYTPVIPVTITSVSLHMFNTVGYDIIIKLLDPADKGYCILDKGCWILVKGYWTKDIGYCHFEMITTLNIKQILIY